MNKLADLTDEQKDKALAAVKRIADAYKPKVDAAARELGEVGSMVTDSLLCASMLYANAKKDPNATIEFWHNVIALAELMLKVDAECFKARSEYTGEKGN